MAESKEMIRCNRCLESYELYGADGKLRDCPDCENVSMYKGSVRMMFGVRIGH